MAVASVDELREQLAAARRERERAERASEGEATLRHALARARRDRDAHTTAEVEALREAIEDAETQAAHDLEQVGRYVHRIRRLVGSFESGGVLREVERQRAVDAAREAIDVLDAAGIEHELEGERDGQG